MPESQKEKKIRIIKTTQHQRKTAKHVNLGGPFIVFVQLVQLMTCAVRLICCHKRTHTNTPCHTFMIQKNHNFGDVLDGKANLQFDRHYSS